MASTNEYRERGWISIDVWHDVPDNPREVLACIIFDLAVAFRPIDPTKYERPTDIEEVDALNEMQHLALKLASVCSTYEATLVNQHTIVADYQEELHRLLEIEQQADENAAKFSSANLADEMFEDGEE